MLTGPGEKILNKVEDVITNTEADDMLVSGVVAALTDSTLLGAAVGGSLTGALIGDALDGDIFDDIF